MHSEEYWNLLRARHALNLMSEHEVLELIGMNQKTICARMENSARAVRKELYIGSNLTKDCFLDMMNDENFIVRKWSVTIKKPGELNSGYNFYVEGHYLKYLNNNVIHCEYPFKCNTTLDCRYANICKSPLAEIQQKISKVGLLPKEASYYYSDSEFETTIFWLNNKLTIRKECLK